MPEPILKPYVAKPLPNIPLSALTKIGDKVGKPNSFFYWSVLNPQAVVVLNRGTSFEIDLTPDVMSFTTTNTISDILGSFNVTISNVRDKYIDRYGYNLIKKMSSIEIFVNSSNAESAGDGEGDFTLTIDQAAEKSGESPDHFITRIYAIFLNSAFITDQNFNKDEIWNFIKIKNIPYYESQLAALRTSLGDNKETRDEAIKNNTQSTGLLSIIGNDDRKLGAEGDRIVKVLNILNTKGGMPGTEFAAGTKLLVPPVPMAMNRIFFGVLTTISEVTTPGDAQTLNLTGRSVGYWLEASVIDIKPALITSQLLGRDVTAFTNKYAELTALQIFQELLKFSTNDIIPLQDYNLNTVNSGADLLTNSGLTGINMIGGVVSKTDDNGQQVAGKIEAPSSASLVEQSGEVAKQLRELPTGKNVPVAGLNNVNLHKWKNQSTYNSAYDRWVQLSAEYNQLLEEQEKNAGAIKEGNFPELGSEAQAKQDPAKTKAGLALDDKSKILSVKLSKKLEEFDGADMGVYAQTKQYLTNLLDDLSAVESSALQAGRQKLLKQFGVIDIWKQVFSRITLEVMNSEFLGKIHPYNLGLSSPDLFDGDFQTKSEIAQNIADKIFFEFYFDTNGHFVLKPPMYNAGIQKDSSVYILEDNDITTININDTIEGVLTSVNVVGQFYEMSTIMPQILQNTYQDLSLMAQYGYHGTSLADLTFIRNVQDAAAFGNAYLLRNNQKLLSASVTITGRSQMRLGVSTYLKPRDIVFYITGISHQFNAGGEYLTTLTLDGGRRIVYGLRVNSVIKKLNTIYPSAKGQYIVLELLDFNTGGQAAQNTIGHYILAANSNINLTNLDTPLEPVAGDTEFAQTFVIVKNALKITNFPDPAFIGLVVDGSSPIIQAVNITNFNQLYSISPPSSTLSLKAAVIASANGKLKLNEINPSLVSLQNTLETQKNVYVTANAFSLVGSLFKYFATTPFVAIGSGFWIGDSLAQGDVADGVKSVDTVRAEYDSYDPGEKIWISKIGKLFTLNTYEHFNQFAFNVLSRLSEETVSPESDLGVFLNNNTPVLDMVTGKPSGDTILSVMKGNAYINDNAYNLLTGIINSNIENGSYRLYTDDEGREYPANLNYGLSAVEDFAIRSLAKKTGAQEIAANKEKLRAENASKALQAIAPKAPTAKT
jgi:hypothetical protein